MIDGRLIAVTSGVAALGIALGDWGTVVGPVAAALVVGTVAKRRGGSWRRALGVGALAAVATTFMWVPALVLVVFLLPPFDSTATDPWYDYLALPGAPLVLLVQGVALFVPNRALRWALLGGGAVAIAVMFAYVATLDLDDEGANIGAGVLFIFLGASLALVAAGLGRDRVRRSASRESAR